MLKTCDKNIYVVPEKGSFIMWSQNYLTHPAPPFQGDIAFGGRRVGAAFDPLLNPIVKHIYIGWESPASDPHLTALTAMSIGGYTDVNNLTNFWGANISYWFTLVYSDNKIKKNVVEINDNKAIKDVNLLKPCTYEFINRDEGIQYGFLAQEIREVLPNIVSIHRGSIPLIMLDVNVISKGSNSLSCKVISKGGITKTDAIIEIIDFDSFDYKIGSPLLIIDLGEELRCKITKIVNNNISIDTSLKSENTIIIKSQHTSMVNAIIEISNPDQYNLKVNTILNIKVSDKTEHAKITKIAGNHIYIDRVLQTNSIYIEGIVVDDLHSISISQIIPITVSAIQELDRQFNAKNEEIDILKNEIATFKIQMAEGLARLNAAGL